VRARHHFRKCADAVVFDEVVLLGIEHYGKIRREHQRLRVVNPAIISQSSELIRNMLCGCALIDLEKKY